MSGWLIICCEIGDLVQTSTGFIEFWLYVYLLVGSLLVLVVDMPIMLSRQSDAVRRVQLLVFSWVKLFRRMWGRAILYTVLMFSCSSFLANDDDPSDFRAVPWICGIYLLLLIVPSFVFSVIAARKYNAIRTYVIESTVLPPPDADDSDEEDAVVRQMTESGGVDDELAMRKFIAKFDELDANDNGQLTMNEVAKLGAECGNAFSHSELHAMMLLLDKECNGVITKPEYVWLLSVCDGLEYVQIQLCHANRWILQFRKHHHLKLL